MSDSAIPMDCSPPGISVNGIFPARVLEWVAISFSRGVFLTLGSNPGLPHWRQMLYPLSHQGSPTPPLPRCQCSKESIDIPTSSSINGLAFLGTDSRAGPRLVSTLNPLCLGIPKLVIATQFFPDLLVQWLAAHRTLRRGLELGQH